MLPALWHDFVLIDLDVGAQNASVRRSGGAHKPAGDLDTVSFIHSSLFDSEVVGDCRVGATIPSGSQSII